MKSKFKLSVAIPVYNGAKKLKKQFDRIFKDCDNKKFNNFLEIVISDNCSTDNTKKVVFYYKKKSLINKNIIIRYYKQKKNIGFPKNFIGLPKLVRGKYILYLSDDDLPGRGFYKELKNSMENINCYQMLIAPVGNSRRYFKSLFGLNKISYIINRGSILSGIIINTKLIKYTSFLRTLYPQTELYLDYFLKYGMRDLKIKSVIYNLDKKKNIAERISSNDRMNRKYDFALLDKVKISEKFYKKKRINFIEFFYSIYSIYKWGLAQKKILRNSKAFRLERLFFNEITKYRRKNLLNLIFLLIFLKNLFSKDRIFYYQVLKKKLFDN